MTKRNKGIELSPEMIRYVWGELLTKFEKHIGTCTPGYFREKPEEFWKDQGLRKNFIKDLEAKTTHKVSKIVLIRYEEDEITEDYINNHFVKRTHSKFQPGYLDRFAFYLTQGKTKYWNDYLKAVEGIVPVTPDKPDHLILPGLKKLEGYWVGLNKNVKEGRYVKCRYRIWQEGNVMKVEREGFNNEVCFQGQVIMQDDASFAFLLHGKERKGFKHLVANGGNPEPETLKCVGTAMSTEYHRQVIVKEFLYKVPHVFAINTAEVIKFENLQQHLMADFGEEDVSGLLGEILDFLGEKETSVFPIEDLSLIKSYHLEKIKNEASNAGVSVIKDESLNGALLHLDNEEEAIVPLQQKKILRFYQDKKENVEKGIRIGREIYEDYIFMKFLNIKLNLQLNLLFNFKMKFLKR